jgi:hypothetical protein
VIHRRSWTLTAQHTRLRRLAELFFTALCLLHIPATLYIARAEKMGVMLLFQSGARPNVLVEKIEFLRLG